MNVILPSDFQINKYGLLARLVKEEDAGFIVELRKNPKLSRYLSTVDDDVEKQRSWIREYKIRERQGLDYYFIYFSEGKPVGLNRIYNIHDNVFTYGSWICLEELPFHCALATCLIARELAFHELGKDLEMEIGGTHVDNKKVIRFSEMLGMVYDGYRELDKGLYRTGYLKKEAFEENLPLLQRFIPIV